MVEVFIQPLDLAKLQLVPHGWPLTPETVLVVGEGELVSALPIEGVLYCHWARLVILQQLTACDSLLDMDACMRSTEGRKQYWYWYGH